MLVLIPARGGSKGVPGKNIKLLGDKPLIAHTIEAALQACSVDRVVVTTDSKEIADVAQTYGAEVPFLRPTELATDDSSAVDVYLHAVQALNRSATCPTDTFMVLLPTTPFRTAKDIDTASDLYRRAGASTLVSMVEAETPPSWYHVIDAEGRVRNAFLNEGDAVSNRQNYGRYFIPNGSIYILNYELLLTKRTYYDSSTIAYIMPAERSLDIDTPFDFLLAEALLSYKNP